MQSLSAAEQNCPNAHGQVKLPPQPSSWTSPHSNPTSSQVLRSQPQTLDSPAPPHTSFGPQTPQSSSPPHPSERVPQFLPRPSQVKARHSHLLGPPPPPQMPGKGQVPQYISPPQPSGTEPHSAPAAAQVRFWQPQTLGSRAPQTSEPEQLPQFRVFPHPSST